MAGGTLGLPAGIPSDNMLDLQPGLEAGAPGIQGQAVTIGTYDDYTRRVNKLITQAESHFMSQREKMAEAWRFESGHQLSDDDLRILRQQRRPDTAINEMQKFLVFASGVERRTRPALIFAAVTAEDQQAALKGELVTKAYEWFLRQSSGNDERSRAFYAKIVAGLGIVDVGLSRKKDPNGKPRYTYCPAKQFLFPKCAKTNWGLDTDAPIQWIGRETKMDVEEAIDKWPDYAIYFRASSGYLANDQFPNFGKGAKRPIDYVVPWIMTEPLNKGGGGGSDDEPGKVKILEWQDYEDQDGYYFYDPIQRDDAWLNSSDFRKLRNRYQVLFKSDIEDFEKFRKRIFRRSYFLNRRIRLEGPKPLTDITGDEGYTWNVMTGVWDDHDEVWVGKSQLFLAPQRYANSCFRQVLEVLGSSHKNGAFVETTAMTVAQKRDYEERGSAPGSINMVQPNAISGNKILLKNVPQLPQGTMEVLSFCIDMMEKVSGLSTSLLGQAPGATPGISLRRQMTSGMVLLAAEFDGLTRFTMRDGRLIFNTTKLIADDRWIRIGGAYDGQAIQLTKDPFALDYDLEMDETDQDPNLRQYYTDMIMQIAPILVRTGNFMPELLDYVNLPVQFREKLKQTIQQNEQQKMQMTMQGISVGGRGKPRGLQEIKADTDLKNARATEHMAKAKAIMQKPQNERLKTVFDAVGRFGDMAQKEREMNIDALAKLFQALKEKQKPAEQVRDNG